MTSPKVWHELRYWGPLVPALPQWHIEGLERMNKAVLCERQERVKLSAGESATNGIDGTLLDCAAGVNNTAFLCGLSILALTSVKVLLTSYISS